MVNIDSIESIFIGIAVPYIFYIYILNRQYKYNIIKNEFFYTFIVYLIIIFAVIVVFLNGAKEKETHIPTPEYSTFFTEEKKNLMYNQACWKTKKFIDTYTKLYEKLDNKMTAVNLSYSDFFNKITNNHSDLIKLDTMKTISKTQNGGTARQVVIQNNTQVIKLKEILTEYEYLITLNSANYISNRLDLSEVEQPNLIRDLIISEHRIQPELLRVGAKGEREIQIFNKIDGLGGLVEVDKDKLRANISTILVSFNTHIINNDDNISQESKKLHDSFPGKIDNLKTKFTDAYSNIAQKEEMYKYFFSGVLPENYENNNDLIKKLFNYGKIQKDLKDKISEISNDLTPVNVTDKLEQLNIYIEDADKATKTADAVTVAEEAAAAAAEVAAAAAEVAPHSNPGGGGCGFASSVEVNQNNVKNEYLPIKHDFGDDVVKGEVVEKDVKQGIEKAYINVMEEDGRKKYNNPPPDYKPDENKMKSFSIFKHANKFETNGGPNDSELTQMNFFEKFINFSKYFTIMNLIVMLITLFIGINKYNKGLSDKLFESNTYDQAIYKKVINRNKIIITILLISISIVIIFNYKKYYSAINDLISLIIPNVKHIAIAVIFFICLVLLISGLLNKPKITKNNNFMDKFIKNLNRSDKHCDITGTCPPESPQKLPSPPSGNNSNPEIPTSTYVCDSNLCTDTYSTLKDLEKYYVFNNLQECKNSGCGSNGKFNSGKKADNYSLTS